MVYLWQQHMKGRREFLMVALLCWDTILSISIDTAYHVVELRGSEYTCRGRGRSARETRREEGTP